MIKVDTIGQQSVCLNSGQIQEAGQWAPCSSAAEWTPKSAYMSKTKYHLHVVSTGQFQQNNVEGFVGFAATVAFCPLQKSIVAYNKHQILCNKLLLCSSPYQLITHKVGAELKKQSIDLYGSTSCNHREDQKISSRLNMNIENNFFYIWYSVHFGSFLIQHIISDSVMVLAAESSSSEL